LPDARKVKVAAGFLTVSVPVWELDLSVPARFG
jgi:hypothetical protein